MHSIVGDLDMICKKRKKVFLLDCTLRDGGYVNNWDFGQENIKKMLLELRNASINIIECGFLSEKKSCNDNFSLFKTVDSVSKVIPVRRDDSTFVCMINYGEYNIENLPNYDGSSIDGIRVAFHKKDVIPALAMCQRIKEKGYKVFIQPMVSLSYSDEEFLSLITEVNTISPYAFYIVDSFGAMKQEHLLHIFRLAESHLSSNIAIGYHSHNNLQLAFSNAQSILREPSVHDLILDSSVFGMGRGAGNLNTELIIGYLNDYFKTNFFVKPILIIIDEILNKIYDRFFWGYSLPHYLSATHNCHPNYASALEEKKTLTVDSINTILSEIPESKKHNFDSFLLEQLYLKFQSKNSTFLDNLNSFKSLIASHPILIIGPGKSVETEKEKVLSFIDKYDPISISINFDYHYSKSTFIFTSNLKRYNSINELNRERMIVTSNIPNQGVYLQINYGDLVNNIPSVRDNSGILLIQFLINCGAKEINIAGIDGYNIDSSENFASSDLILARKKTVNDNVNAGLKEMLDCFKKSIKINFITKSMFS